MARVFFVLIVAASFLAGCANVPIKDGELVLDANTRVGMEDIGAARVTRGF